MSTGGEVALAAIARAAGHDEAFPNQDLLTIRLWRTVLEAHRVPLSVAVEAVDAWYARFPGTRITAPDVAQYAIAHRRRESEQNRTSPGWASRSKINSPVLSEIRRHGQTVDCRTCRQLAGEPCVNLHDRAPLLMVVHPSRTKDADLAAAALTTP